MDSSGSIVQRRSRFRRQPTGKTLCTSPRDIEIFKLLRRYRYLSSNFIEAFVGGNSIRLKQRLGDLYHEGYLDRPDQQWQTFNARYRPATYELGRLGRAALVQSGSPPVAPPPRTRNFAHEALVSLVGASMELGVLMTANTQYLSWETLFATRMVSVAEPLLPIQVAISYAGRQLEFSLRPDGQPFAISLRSGGKTRTYYFPGIEVDRNTEPLTAADLARSSILRKILGYRELVASNSYREHLGLPNMFVPIVTVNAVHMENMRRLILDLTHGKGASYLLLKTVPDFFDSQFALRPGPELFREPWTRAGYPPLCFAEE